jgi:hypothetical protein
VRLYRCTYHVIGISTAIPLTHPQTLHSFVKEAGLPSDVGSDSGDHVTIESVLHEKKAFDTSLNFEKLGLDDGGRGWTVQAPHRPTIVESLPGRSNILSVSVFKLLLRLATGAQEYVAVTTADRKLHLLNPSSSTFELIHSYTSFQDSPILDVIAIGCQYLRRDHTKYVVKVVSHSDGNTTWVASAGWDAKIVLYRIDCASDTVQLGEPMAVLALPSTEPLYTNYTQNQY